MDDDNQILVPPSFIALFQDGRGRLRTTAATLRTRYELCEDLACQLIEQAQQLLHTSAPSEPAVLSALHTALAHADSGLSPEEAHWVSQRLAELLGWPSI